MVAAGDADPCTRFPASIGVSVDLALWDALRFEHRVAPEPEEGVGRPGVVQGPRASQPLERPEGAGQRAEAGFAAGGWSPSSKWVSSIINWVGNSSPQIGCEEDESACGRTFVLYR